MHFSDFIGMTGVAILLIAFLMTLTKKLSTTDKRYALMNAVGAGLSCYASFLIGYVPFVVLEATWALVSLMALVKPKLATH